MADLNGPDIRRNRDPRLIGNAKPPVPGTRCTFVADGQSCGTFPSWPVAGSKNERRCEAHRE